MAAQSCHSPSRLESLATDVLQIILSSSTSLRDLYALIHASPTLYWVFFQTKASILLKVCSHDLGPAIRDAIFLAHIELHGPVGSDQVDGALTQWRQRLLSKEDRWLAGGISVAEAIQVVRINRTVQWFVDTYVQTRFACFEGKARQLGNPAAAAGTWQLSPTERWNLSQAFIRRQAILRLYCDTRPPDHPGSALIIANKALGLFAPWEKEQISQADGFVWALCLAWRACGEPRQWCDWNEVLLWARQFYLPAFKPLVRDPYAQLSTLRRCVTQAAAADPGFVDRMYMLRHTTWVPTRMPWHMFLHGTLRLPRAPPPPPGAPPPPCNRTSKSPVETPWAWTEAMAGSRIEDLWGNNLLAITPVSTFSMMTQLDANTFGMCQRWKWAGFVFWDRARAETLQKNKLLGKYADPRTGWLAAPWKLGGID